MLAHVAGAWPTPEPVEARMKAKRSIRPSTEGRQQDAHLGRAHAGQPLTTRAVFYLVQHRVGSLIRRPVHPHMLRHGALARYLEGEA